MNTSMERLAWSLQKFSESVPQTVQAITASALAAVNVFASATEVYLEFATEQDAVTERDKLTDWVKRNLEHKHLIDHALEWAEIQHPRWVHQYKYAKKHRVRNKYKNRILREYTERS